LIDYNEQLDRKTKQPNIPHPSYKSIVIERKNKRKYWAVI
jgi:hypothetical protein